jgi:hypothetical protein
MFRRLAALGVAAGLMWAVAVAPAAAATPVWVATQVTTGTAQSEALRISSDRLVWRTTGTTPRTLFTWKVGDSAPTTLAVGTI